MGKKKTGVEAMMQEAFRHMQENDERHEKWSVLTESASVNDVRPEVRAHGKLVGRDRRALEVLMENTVDWTQTAEAKGVGVDPISDEVLDFVLGRAEENAVTTANISAFTTAAFPLIRRVYPNLVSQYLCTVQPIPTPSAMLFFLDFKYGNSMAPVARGDLLNDRSIVNGQSRFVRARNYSGGKLTGEAVATGDASTTTFYLAWFPIKNGSVTIYVNGSATAPSSIDYETGKVVMSAAPANGAAITADYNLVFEGTGPIPSIELQMSSDNVQIETHKLKTQWSLESAMDAMTQHGIDIDSELLTVMADEMTREIDSLLIYDIITAAQSGQSAGNVNWSTTVGSGYSPIEWQRTLLDAFVDGSQLIHQKRLRYANWILVGDDVATRLQKMSAWSPNVAQTPGGGVQGSIDQFYTPVVNGQGPAFIGTLNQKYMVIHDPVHVPAGQAIMGFRGNSMLDTAYIYAPYQPLYVTPVFQDPNDFTPRRGIMTRFGRKLISAEFFSTITVS